MPERLLLAVGLFWATSAMAGIYSWTDADGRVHYTDRPVPGSHAHHGGGISSVENPDFNLAGFRRRIPFREQHGSMLVGGSVNGIPIRFIVDTGASLVVIPPAVAARAEIRTEGAPRVELQTANGRVRAPRIRLDELRLGPLGRRNVDAVVQRISDDGQTGLLGMSFLDAFRLTVDRDNRQLILEDR